VPPEKPDKPVTCGSRDQGKWDDGSSVGHARPGLRDRGAGRASAPRSFPATDPVVSLGHNRYCPGYARRSRTTAHTRRRHFRKGTSCRETSERRSPPSDWRAPGVGWLQRRLAAACSVTGRLRRPHLTPGAVAPHGCTGLRLRCPESYGEPCWRLPRAAQVSSACELQPVHRGDSNRSPCMVAKDVVSKE
jgi:hypothetical protein